MIVGPARGSSAGSLVCYLTGITTVDPLKHGLIFERFIDLNRGGWFIKDEALP
jgi:DNA polymerase III alpha subunit